jgi:hypothetical protein
MSEQVFDANPVVKFLSGGWQNQTYIVHSTAGVDSSSYREEMKAVDQHTLSITAFDYPGKGDITREMRVEVLENSATLSQGPFVAKGVVKANMLELTGELDKKMYVLRLYMLGERFVFHREVWAEGVVESTDFSWLTPI